MESKLPSYRGLTLRLALAAAHGFPGRRAVGPSPEWLGLHRAERRLRAFAIRLRKVA